MLSLLVVDDEVLIADSLCRMLQEHYQDTLVVRRCYSFYEAQAILEKQRVDMLLTDIDMPDVSGLELHGWVSRRWPMIKVIYLTGYPDFSYAQQAVQLHAQDYVLKSEGDEVILRAIDKAIAAVEEESASLLEKARLFAPQDTNDRRAVQELLRGGTVPDDALAEPPYPFVRFGYCYLETLPEGHDIRACSNLVEALLPRHMHPLTLPVNERAFTLVCESAANDDPALLCGTLDLAQQILERQRAIMTVCLLDAPVIRRQLAQANRRLLEQIQLRAPDNGELVLLSMAAVGETDTVHDTVSIRQKERDAALLRHFQEYLLAGQRDLYFEGEGRTWVASLSYTALEAWRLYRMLAGILGNIAEQLSLAYPALYDPVGEYSRAETASREDAVCRADVNRLRQQLRDLAEQIFTAKGEKQSIRHMHVVRRVNEYISEHLSEDLTLTSLSDAMHFHPAYLSRIYKATAGIALSDAIAHKRLGTACGLLCDPGVSVNAVSHAVGFASANYFSRWFRKWMSMTPQEYRDAHCV